MKINAWVIAIIAVSIIAFVVFIVRRNKVDQKVMENELNERELDSKSHEDPTV